LKYDKLYTEIYEQRRKIIIGQDISNDAALLQEYETRAQELNDEEYKKIEVTACDVKDFQNTPKGVYGFWLKTILNHPMISTLV
jgi:hypothetical protein